MKYFHEEQYVLSEKLDAAEKTLFAFMILPLTQQIAMQSAKIETALTKSGKIIGINNTYIAATALVNKVPVVTRNVSEFKRVEGLEEQGY